MSAAVALPSTGLWLVRHGETDWNAKGRYHGQTDIPLNAAGLAQAQALLPIFADRPITAIYSSDLQKATTTAGLLGETLRLPVKTHRGLREAGLGRWEGMLLTDIQGVYAAAWKARRRDPVNVRRRLGERNCPPPPRRASRHRVAWPAARGPLVPGARPAAQLCLRQHPRQLLRRAGRLGCGVAYAATR